MPGPQKISEDVNAAASGFSARIQQVWKGESPDLHSAGEIDGRKGVQSVDIAFAILRVLEAAIGPLSLAEITRRSGFPPSKVHHYLVSLTRNAVAEQRADGRYTLGSYALTLGLSALGRLDIVEGGATAVEAFRDSTGESALLAVFGNRGPTVIRYFSGTRPVTVETRAGLVVPLMSSATGRVFLAWGSEAVWRPIADEEVRRGGVGSIERLRSDTRARGVAIVEGDLVSTISAISVPVFLHDGALAGAITSLGLRGEFDISLTGDTVRRLHALGADLSRRFGHRDYPQLPG